MPSKYRLRYIFKPLIGYLAKVFNRIGMSPNSATSIMLLNSILSLLFLILLQNKLLFSIFVFLTGIFDGIDGAIARLSQKESEFGGFFDSVMDRVSEFFIFWALLVYFWNSQIFNIIDMKFIVVLSFFGSIMISYLRGRAELLYQADYDFGLMARSERLFYIFIMMLISYFYGIEIYLMFILMLLILLTALFRFYKIKTLIEKFQGKSDS